MTREELMMKADAYIKENGFPPGVIYVRRDKVFDIMEAYRTTLVPQKIEVLEKLMKEGVENLEKIPLMGMAVVLKDPKEQEEAIVLGRQTGRVTRIKPQGMKEAYMPVADITNGMGSIMKAAYAFFDDAEGDEAFVEFAKKTAILMHSAKEAEQSWATGCLDNLQNMCEDFSKNSGNAQAFFIKFFMCVVDFYWHCSKLVPGEDLATDSKAFKKALDVSAFIRTMPEDMRKQYLEHIAAYGMLPDILGRRNIEED